MITSILLSFNPKFHGINNHFEVDVYFVIEKFSKSIFKIVRIILDKQSAKFFTKSLTFGRHNFYVIN